ncbi:hypothetical protein Poli38472_005822 [Pythium oligandrum]|uniref:Uncharacterized protein n=1 Tax=Pythium oligandrum TaxID=41045 RepID=A0A8K1FPG8_PYTOL|nr:hypothetical protein Poli38472_005822 [Pythium oligandrum]|eukprot:TMW68354.1 hypothetical protein Poli38472_005822 [Pythium oligandrum]
MAEIEPPDEILWLHASEYSPWGVHASKTQDPKRPSTPSSPFSAHFGLTGAQAALLNDRIAVVVGGRDHPLDRISSTCRLDLFDLRDDKWLATVDIKGELTPRIGHSVASVAGNVVVFGGEQAIETDLPEQYSTTLLSDCYELHLAQNVLSCSVIDTSTSPTALCARAWHTATSVHFTRPGSTKKSDGMVVLGGCDATGKFLDDVWVLVVDRDPASPEIVNKSWMQLSPTGNSPLPLAYHSAVAVEDGAKIVVVGGRHEAQTGMLDSVFVLDLVGNAWNQVTLTGLLPDSIARCRLTAISLNVPIDETTGRLLQIKKPEPNASGSEEELQMPPSESRILVFGGVSESAPTTDVSRLALLDLEKACAREIHAPTLGLRSFMNHACVTSSDAKSVYFFGGIDPMTRQYVDSTTAIHFWKLQPGAGDNDEEDNNANAIRTKPYENGDVYTGEMDRKGEIRHGQGKCVYADGRVYEGEWIDDHRHGNGVMTYADGTTYAGEWEADQRHGYGIQEAGSSDAPGRREKRYEGTWSHDKRDGKGTVTYSDGSRIEANWQQGVSARESCRIEGYDDGNGVCTYIGDVENGLPHGNGESRHAKEMYVGEWDTGKRSGQGISTLFDGTTYRGEWRNGKRNGFGVCEYARTRDRFDGKWVGDVRCGRGVCYYANGSQYDGQWKDDKCHGVGRYTYPDSTFYEGQWKENRLCGDGAFVLNLDDEHPQDEA